MSKRTIVRMTLAVLVVAGAAWMAGNVTVEAKGGRAGETGVIYVVSQGLYYDTFATADPLPPHGRFQELVIGPNGPETEFGPGDPGYLGGRWAADFDGDGEYHYFLCPLLGPGRLEP